MARNHAAAGRKGRPRTYSHSGLYALKTQLRARPSPLSRRYKLGRTLFAWRQDVIADLGGPQNVTTQQVALVDVMVKTKLLLDSVDAWLLTQNSLIDKRRRGVYPIVRDRQQLADGLTRNMLALGLERRGSGLDLARALQMGSLPPPRRRHQPAQRGSRGGFCALRDPQGGRMRPQTRPDLGGGFCAALTPLLAPQFQDTNRYA